MNLILSQSFINYSVTARSQTYPYVIANIKDYFCLERCFKAADATVGDWLLKIDLGSGKSPAGIFLNWINFDKVTVNGYSDAFITETITTTVDISNDNTVDRYKVYIPLDDFTQRYIGILIPPDATITNGSVWQIGSVVALEDLIELNRNSTSYSYLSDIPFVDVKVNGRLSDRIMLGNHLKWSGTISFGNRHFSQRDELSILNKFSMADPVIFYENLMDTSKAYLCIKDSFHKITINAPLYASGNSINYSELI